MAGWIEQKYINLLSGSLRNFKVVDDRTYNFSCPICGDSKKSKRKARGFVYEKEGKTRYKCHNCGYSSSFKNLLEEVDPRLADEFRRESYSARIRPSTTSPVADAVFASSKPVFSPEPDSDPTDELECVEGLPSDHPAVQLVTARKIPPEFWGDLYYAENFWTWAGEYSKNVIKDRGFGDTPRLVIPFRDADGTLRAFQGRAFGRELPKYVTLKIDETFPKVYGLDRLDRLSHAFATEGPIDSMFLENAVAFAGGDCSVLREVFVPADVTVVYDNEPRSRDTVAKMEKAIAQGFRLFVWPEYLTQKDVNDAILEVMTPGEFQDLVKSRSYFGLEARMRLSEWRRV